MPLPAPRRPRARGGRLIAGLLAVQLGVGLTAVVRLQNQDRAAAGTSAPSVTRRSPVRPDLTSRTVQVQALLAARAAAVLHKDRAGFLATIDPSRTAFRTRQAALIGALSSVPLASWTYELDPSDAQPSEVSMDRRRGTWWAPAVTLRYSLAGFDREPTAQRQALTFVQRTGHWYIAADDDFAAVGHATSRDLWDGGPVRVTVGSSCLVLAHPAGLRRERSMLAECEQAVRRVTDVWGRGWSQRVVMLLPDTASEMATMVPDAGDVHQIAAVATAELLDPGERYYPVGDRVVINPTAFAELGQVGRRVVLTHEVTHVASRAASGPQVPTWLVEGLADYAGYLGVDLPLSVSASELRAEVRKGRLPSTLPVNADFKSARADLAATYEQSWLAVVLLVRKYGQSAVLGLYRTMGADQVPGAVERAFRARLGLSVGDFSALWRADLKRRLA